MKTSFNKNAASRMLAAMLSLLFLACGSNVMAQITLADPAVQITSNNVTVNYVDGTLKVPLLDFTLNNTSDRDTKVTTIDAQVNWVTTVTTFYVFDGDTLVSSAAAQGGFSGTIALNVVLPKNTSKTYRLKADFAWNTPGENPEAQAMVWNVKFEKADATIGTASGAVTGNTQHFFAETAQYHLKVLPTIEAKKSADGTTYLEATYIFNVRAVAGNVKSPVASDFDIRFLDVINVERKIATSVETSLEPNTEYILDGATHKLTVVAKMSGPFVDPKGFYVARVNSIKWRFPETQPVTQGWGLEAAITPLTNVSIAEQKKLTVFQAELFDEQSSERDNTFVMNVIVPPTNQTFEVQYSNDLASWHTGSFGFGSDTVVTLQDGSRVFKALLFAPRLTPANPKKRFYRIIIP